MKISDYLRTENIILDIQLPDKSAVLRFIAETCIKNGVAADEAVVIEGLIEREKTMSTGVGGGLAFPHTTSAEVEEAAVILVRPAKPVSFEALDKKPVDIIVALIIPQKDRELHVRLLARISRLCREPEFLDAVRNSRDPSSLKREIQKIEQETIFN